MDRRVFLLGALAAPAVRAAGQVEPGPLALATADVESAVVAVNPASGRVVRRIAAPPGPRSIEAVASGTLALAAHTAHGLLTLVEGDRPGVRAEIGGLGRPRYTAAAPDGRLAYVTDEERGELVVVDVVRARILRRVAVGQAARHLGIHPSGRVLWVALGFSAPALVAVDLADPARPRPVRRIVPVYPAHDVCFSPDGRDVWVTAGRDRAVVVHDARSGRPRLRLAADAPPQHVAVLGGSAYVTSGAAGTLRAHALASGRARWLAHVPVGSYNVVAGAGRVLTPSLDVGSLSVLSPGGRFTGHERVARRAHDACLLVT